MWLMVTTVMIAQMCSAGMQASAQPIFRAPRQPGSVQQPLANETLFGEIEPIRTRIAPIQQVGSGAAASRFQLPQTESTGGFFQPGSPSNQIAPNRGDQNFGNQNSGQRLREVGADGSFLPVQGDIIRDPNQAEAMLDLPGIDLSAMGLDLQDRQAPADRSTGQGNGSTMEAGEDLEQLPSALGQFEVPQDPAERTDNVRREQVIENYPDGQPRLLRTVALDREGNYYNDGPWVVKDRDGKVVAAGTYRKGVMQGPWARRHTSAEGGMFTEKPFTSYQGPFDSMANFKAGKLDGQWIVYDRAKRSVFEIGYEEGKRNGLATWFYPDTTKMRQATFKQGVLDGEVIEWDEDGRVVSKEFYRDGRKLIRNTSFYRPEVPKEESYFLDVKLRQNGLDNWWDAKPAPYLASGKRIQNGQARAWYPNRQLQHQGQFSDDKPVGRFFWWHENGNRSTVGQFNRAGDRDGRWIWWHDNGMKRIEGSYKNDQPSGVWRSWDEAGKLIKSKDYNALSGQTTGNQVDPLQGVDPRDEEELLEGSVKTEPADESSASDVPGQIEGNGFLPLPQDGSDDDQEEPAIPSVPSEQNGPSLGPQFESLPPAIGEESFEDESTAEKSIMRSVGVDQGGSVVNRKPASQPVTGGFVNRPAVEPGVGVETGSALITNEVDGVRSFNQLQPRLVNPVPRLEVEADEAVEPFDLSELLD